MFTLFMREIETIHPDTHIKTKVVAPVNEDCTEFLHRGMMYSINSGFMLRDVSNLIHQMNIITGPYKQARWVEDGVTKYKFAELSKEEVATTGIVNILRDSDFTQEETKRILESVYTALWGEEVEDAAEN